MYYDIEALHELLPPQLDASLIAKSLLVSNLSLDMC